MAYRIYKGFLLFLLLAAVNGCAFKSTSFKRKPSLTKARALLVDKNATEQTAALFYNLKRISEEKILFGHQEATRQGYGWNWRTGLQTPDVKAVSGQMPAVYGWDFIDIASFKPREEVRKVEESVRAHILEGYKRGGLHTFSWHYSNPVSEGSFYWEKSPVEAVSQILPGGAAHGKFKRSLREIADFSKSLQVDGHLVPLIFRPWHEFDGEWFWWGKDHRSPEEFKQLFRFTVTYLRDSLQVHNMLYAWSPDCRFSNQEEFLREYPGDEYVDLVGTDNYWDLKEGKDPAVAGAKFKLVSDFAKSRNKLAAVTESGLLNVSQADWYSQMLMKALQYDKMQLAYVLLWHNRQDEFWTPFKGHPAEQDFVQFLQHPYVLTEENITDLYQIKRKLPYRKKQPAKQQSPTPASI
jgi:mannan endo-1,4-beta-mannosidase